MLFDHQPVVNPKIFLINLPYLSQIIPFLTILLHCSTSVHLWLHGKYGLKLTMLHSTWFTYTNFSRIYSETWGKLFLCTNCFLSSVVCSWPPPAQGVPFLTHTKVYLCWWQTKSQKWEKKIFQSNINGEIIKMDLEFWSVCLFYDILR